MDDVEVISNDLELPSCFRKCFESDEIIKGYVKSHKELQEVLFAHSAATCSNFIHL